MLVRYIFLILVTIAMPGRVSGAPTKRHMPVTVVTSETTAFVGLELTITCTTDSPTDAIWLFKTAGESQVPLVFSDETITSVHNGRLRHSSGYKQSIIIVRNVTWSDAGVYICLRNKVSLEREETTVTIGGFGATSAPGENVTLPCAASGPNISWLYYQSMKVPVEKWIYADNALYGTFRTSGRYHITENYHLSITNLLLNDSGVYACVERNGLGEKHFVELRIFHESYATTDATTVAFDVDDDVSTKTNDIVQVGLTVGVCVALVIMVLVIAVAVIIRQRPLSPRLGRSLVTMEGTDRTTRPTDFTHELLRGDALLPFELLEIVLVKSVVLLKRRTKLSPHADSSAVTTVAAVCQLWRLVLFRGLFIRRTIKRNLNR